MTAVEKAEKQRRRREFMTIFVGGGKMKRVRRPPRIDGVPVEKFIQQNTDPIWLHQNEMFELIDVGARRF